MIAMFGLSFVELLLIVASFGIFVAIIGFVASLFGSRHSTSCHRGLKFPVLIAILVGGVLAPLLGTRRDATSRFNMGPSSRITIGPSSVLHAEDASQVTSMANMTSTAGNASARITSTSQPPDPSLDALWDKLTKSRINLDADASEPAADPTDETAKEAVEENFGLGDEGALPPKWVITPPKQVGPVYRASVASDPWATEEECRQQLVQELLPEAVARRIEYLAPSRVNRKVSVADPALLGIGPDYILREISRDEFTGTVDSSVGEMKKVHVLLEFDKNIDNYLVDAWLRHERQSRLVSFGRIAALSLTGLAAIYGMLRFDTWSKGYYSRQLLVGGTLAIIALAVVLLQ